MNPQLTLGLTAAEQRDATLIAANYPNYLPKTDYGHWLQMQQKPKTHTPSIPLKPNSTARISE
ncbi:hypothetical protein [Rufibacter roseus]|uniref:Uncharacterized protein n=1 Tax=Rufibacter roseus TaxID=1567108 RepID=A0ABW2DN96_9BACT|nr:hypothetical protein [Rufibacter roseus]